MLGKMFNAQCTMLAEMFNAQCTMLNAGLVYGALLLVDRTHVRAGPVNGYDFNPAEWRH